MKPILIRFIFLLSIAAGTEAQTGLIAMPVEIGISHRSGQPFTATEVTTLT